MFTGRVITGRLLLAVGLLLHCAGSMAWAATVEEAIAERRVKAAYLHRFAGYVEWPEGAFAKPDSPLVVGVWGNDELADDLARLVSDRTVEGRRFEVRRLKDADPFGALHMLYVGRERTARLPEAIAGLRPAGTLVVTDSPGGLRPGAVLNFVMSNGQIRFEVSLDAAEKYNLKLSSRLVAVAQNAVGRGR